MPDEIENYEPHPVDTLGQEVVSAAAGIAGYGRLDKVSRLRNPTYREQLLERKRGLEVMLKTVNDAIEIMDRTPEVEQVLDAIRRAGV